MIRSNLLCSLTIVWILVFSLLFIPADKILAKSVDDYLNSAYQFMNQGQYNEAIATLEQGYNENPGSSVAFVIVMAEVYHHAQEYESAIANYLNVVKAFKASGNKVSAEFHKNLINAYNALGERHYFSSELCLRLIYHTEKILSDEPNLENDQLYVNFLRKIVEYYEFAKSGARVLNVGGDEKEFDLYDDGVSYEEKIAFKKQAEKRLFNEAKKLQEKRYQTLDSDRTVAEVMQVIEKKLDSIDSIQFKCMDENDQVFEKIFYRKPDRFKAIQNDAITILKNGDHFVLDTAEEEMLYQSEIDIKTVPILYRIGLDTLYQVKEDYHFDVLRLQNVPDFLNELYGSEDLQPNLYLLTGMLKDPDGGPYPPRPKIELIIDLDLELIVATRDYWIGVLGSGQEYELAKDEIITGARKYQGQYFPNRGKTIGYVREYLDLSIDWSIKDLELNIPIDDVEFHMNQTTRR